MHQSLKSPLPIKSLLLLVSIGLHGAILAMPLPPAPPPPEPEVKANPVTPRSSQRLAIASPVPKVSPASKPSPTPSTVVQPPPQQVFSAPPRIIPQQESAVVVAPRNTSSPNPSPNPSPAASSTPSPSPSAIPSPSPSPFPVSFGGEVFGELGATPGCNGKEGCWQVAGNWRQMVVDSSPLMEKLRSQGYAIKEYRIDDFFQVYSLAKNGETRYLYLFNSPEISPTGDQKTLSLIHPQADLDQSQIEELAQSSNPPPTN